MKYFQEDGLVIKSWCEDPEESAISQAKNLAKLPFAFHHVVLLPDTHSGYGMPIGGVFAAKDVIVPNAVGVDVGCGMCAVKTPWTTDQIDKEALKKIFGGSAEYHGGIRSVVPVGFNKHSKKQDSCLMPKIIGANGNEYPFSPDLLILTDYPIVRKEYQKALYSLGTLGGGNHFLEIQYDSDKLVWIMLHSGSRNLGKQVADRYNEIAIRLNKKWHSGVPVNWQLAFLPIDSDEGQSYLREMNFCVEFALANRKLMMTRVAEIFNDIMKWKKIDMEGMINIAHNYARIENHFGFNVWVHRKGATSARAGEIGIIPGSQGTASYIVKGKGNPESFMSCSHGAGRKMSRTAAIKNLDLDAEKKFLDDQGIMHSVRNAKDLDEAPGSYKDISLVLLEQADLVEVVAELKPMAVIKG